MLKLFIVLMWPVQSLSVSSQQAAGSSHHIHESMQVLVNLESLVECAHEFVIYSFVFIDPVQYQVSWQASQCFNCQHQHKYAQMKFVLL